MIEGDVVLVQLPQANGLLKNRPALVLREMPPFGDLLVCGISTQLRQAVPALDFILDTGDPDFAASGLKSASVIRLGFLVVLPTSAFIGRIGSLPAIRREQLLDRLCKHLRA